MANPSTIPFAKITPQDLSDPDLGNLNRSFETLARELASVEGAFGPYVFRQGLKLADTSLPTDPGAVLCLQAAQQLLGGAGGAAAGNSSSSPASAVSSAVVALTLANSIPSALTGLHADRLANTSAPEPTLFIETDRSLLYARLEYSGAPAWVYIAGVLRGTSSVRPTDLTATDTGLPFYSTDHAILWVWNGTGWKYAQGRDAGTLAGISTAGGVTLGSLDAGLIYDATDYFHSYRWTGSAWTFAPGDPGSGFIVAGTAAPAGGLWQLCDGSAATVSTATGATSSITTPDLNSGAFVRGGPYSATIHPSTSPTWQAGATTDAENLGTPSSGGPSGTTTVQSGTDATVADSSHTHSTAIGSHAHALGNSNAVIKPPSDANGGQPANIQMGWYMRR